MGLFTKLRKVGGSVMIAVPPTVLKQLGLDTESDVSLSVENGRLVIEAHERRPSLATLLAETKKAGRTRRKVDKWTSGKARGRELI